MSLLFGMYRPNGLYAMFFHSPKNFDIGEESQQAKRKAMAMSLEILLACQTQFEKENLSKTAKVVLILFRDALLAYFLSSDNEGES